ncbi:MAG: DUF4405 domain-containing protein [Planctomycetes bacterium]|nr:DUF4405 domain-containing protein [Planctomycetota bacterium]
MKRRTLLMITNVILAVLMTTQIASGLLGHSLPRTAFVLLHKRGAYLLLAVIVVHVALNWTWVRSSFLSRK